MRTTTAPAIALNAAVPARDERGALCLAMPPEAKGAVPEWIELVPAPGANGRIEGVDGRWWTNPDAQAVIAATRLPIPLDVNHATELKAPHGDWAPAVGWIEALEARAGAIWGKAAWGPNGHYAVAQREYRFISPVFLYTTDGGNRILRLANAALTNRPNLDLPALNQAGQPPLETADMTPEQRKALCAQLGIPETASDAEIVEGAKALKTAHQTALNAAKTPDLNLFVPRADLEAQIAKTQTAEKALNDRTQAEHQAKATAAVENAVKEGKVTPASKDFYLATCATAEGLAKFEAFIKGAPVIAPATDIGKHQPGGGGAANAAGLNADQLAMCAWTGVKPEDYAKALA